MVLFLITACSDDGPPRNAAIVNVTANTELTTWLEQSVESFNESSHVISSGRQIYVQLFPKESGQAVLDISSVTQADAPNENIEETALWIPDEDVWISVLADAGNGNFETDCASLAQSPLVIGMWRPVAEALGWPGRSLGWLDIGSLAADPSSWAYYSGGQFGPMLRVGHTHPGLSGTGVSTLLAIVQAAQSKAEAVSVAEIEQPIVQASVQAFEGAVTWFSTDTNTLGQTMRDRGIDYLGAAVMYESTVVRYSQNEQDIVPIYPFEGTFIASHPGCINDAMDREIQEATELFRTYLLGKEAQELALLHGLRPVNEAVPVGAPLDAAHGVDTNQPEIIFGSPSAETLYAAQELWRSARKDVNLVMLLDISGSMEGSKIENVRQAAGQFIQQMGDDDFLTLVAFTEQPILLFEHQQVGPARQSIGGVIQTLEAGGGTALYDAIGAGALLINRSTSSQATNAMVVLTDGLDTNSQYYTFDEQLTTAASAHDTTIFTIAYGNDADEAILTQLADQAKGNFYQGDEANISAIYQELSAAFGGSVGIGR